MRERKAATTSRAGTVPAGAGSSGVDGAVRWALARATGLGRVFPDEIELPDDPDKADLPAVAYRQLSGFRQAYMDRANSPLQTASFLVEVFARTRAECSTLRDVLMVKFAGPVSDDPRAGPARDFGPVRWGDAWVYSAEAGDPTGDADFSVGEAHLLFRFVQLVFSVQFVGVAHGPE